MNNSINQKSSPNPSIKILFNLIIFSVILLELNQTVNANEVVKLDGDIKIKRNGNNKFQQANFLDTINYEDEFQVGVNSWVVIRCDNTDKPKIGKSGTYLVSKYCPQGKETKVNGNNNTFRPPTDDLTKIPYIISPRSSSIFPEQIIIKWNRIAGATSYQVKLGEWQIETTKIEVLYTGKPLKPGYYSVSVKANNGESSGDVGFVIIDATKAQTIRKEAEKIKLEGLDKEAEAYILARFYRSHKLNIAIRSDL